ncbi:hypothetical protein CBR_g31127 [Chara braunii]|uniref:CCHC-type domain-containing protein n=1 Tax=Chara braunii TaxID=69332 RepID=A0A388LEH5_CHABU|nr:hypothetical protein CBR_g31127 [Chara braunii]|eukprot:GBG80667.1 hypothetical protein CBR_g31127 [Chara braunii]
MATSAMSQVSTQSSTSQSGSQVSTSQIAAVRVSHQTQLTPEDLEIRQAEELQDELQRQLNDAAESRRKTILRKARLGSRMQELGRLEALDEAALDPAGRALRNALLSVAEAQNVQQELLADLVAGQKQILAELRAPRTAARQPQFVVIPPANAGPSWMPPHTGQTFSPMFGMPPPGGLAATSGPVQRVSVVPSTIVVTTVPLSSQAQVSVQQPVSVAMQQLQQAPGPMQPMQWMPKIPLMSPKPFSGDRKKEEDLDTWVRTVPTYVRHKLTRPEQEVVVAASFLEGSAARWLNGLVQQQGYDQDFDAWAQAQTLEQFVRSVYNRWHDPQGAQKATDAINNLCSRRFKDVRELTDTVECLLVVPGVRFDQQVLLTDYLRCLPAEVRTKLVDEAYVEQHTFASFSKKALDIEAKLGSAHKVSHDGRKRLPQDWEKKGQLMFVDHDGQTTEIDEFPDLKELTEQDGASETSDGGVVAPIKEKARGTGKKKVGWSTGQGDQGTPAWVKLGLDYEVWRDRVARGTCMNCGNYGHTSRTCRDKKVTTKVASPMVPTGVVEREVVHAIEIVPGSKVPRGRIYRMSPAKLDELRRQLKELTEKGWIRPSTSPYGAPMFFVPKKGGPLRMCIDYNVITVKNAEPLPRIDDLLDRVQGCRYFAKINLKFGYHQIAVRPEDQHKTAFQTRYGLYEFLVMPFGLCNAPGTLQHAMNKIFHDYLDKFIVVYLDDILIFSRTVEEHAEHLKTVLGLLRQH